MFALLVGALALAAPAAEGSMDDPYLWLEDVEDARAMAWVEERNAATAAALEGHPEFRSLYEGTLAILDSRDRIPAVSRHGERLYNFWMDPGHERGVWRRTTLEEYRKAEPAWETVLDVDALARREDVPWVFQGADCFPGGETRCLVSLSRGGGDAAEVREFDLQARAFVPGGFALPEAKSVVSWIDPDTVFVATDFGPGSLTSSGYPRVVKVWKRGTPLSEAQTVFEGRPDDISAYGVTDLSPGHELQIVVRSVTTWSREAFLRLGGLLVKLDLPDDSDLSTQGGRIFVTLRSDWAVGGRTWPSGALLVLEVASFLRGSRAFTPLFVPGERTSLDSFAPLKSAVLVNVLDNVHSRVAVWEPGPGGWTSRPLPGVPEYGTVHVEAVDADRSNLYWMSVADFLTPTTLLLGSADRPEPAERLKSLPAFFDPAGLAVEQHEAVSADGTRVPYFQVGPRGAPADGSRPTLLYGYGGFEIAQTPFYSATVGRSWLTRGHVFVIANIRGGGEFGPRWHRAALRENRARSYEDFVAVAEDLVRRKVTSPGHLGIMGGSNGGLLVGNVMVRRPDLFGAVVCQAPLLDMRRYTRLLAGKSWMEEYGDPDDPAQWSFVRTFSPYHLVKEGVRMPPVLFTTSTRDDRVHPGHARKMAARMLEQGHPVLYLENTEGGHAGSSTHRQAARISALTYVFLLTRL